MTALALKALYFPIHVVKTMDPRYFLAINHTLLIVLGTQLYSMQRSLTQIVLAIGCAIVAEVAIAYATRKHGENLRLYDRVLSAYVIAVGALILVRSTEVWFYAFISVLGVMSKYIFLDQHGRHIYNPTNFAIVVAVLCMPTLLDYRTDQFGTGFWTMLTICIFGPLATWRGNSWRGTLGYIGTIVVAGVPLGMLLEKSPVWIIGPEINSSTLIFMFLMLTDPQTSPRQPKAQWLYGISIALLALGLRFMEFYYYQFIALFIVLSFGHMLWAQPPRKSTTWAVR
jgi:Na+-translocating ferredoxin:NAD+ oxidoreductase RnfD subunit